MSEYTHSVNQGTPRGEMGGLEGGRALASPTGSPPISPPPAAEGAGGEIREEAYTREGIDHSPVPPAGDEDSALPEVIGHGDPLTDEPAASAESSGASPTVTSPADEAPAEAPADDEPLSVPHLGSFRRGAPRTSPTPPAVSTPRAAAVDAAAAKLTPEQRLLILDTWQRSGLPAGDFAELVNLSKFTLYTWKKRFEELGPAGLMDQPRVRTGSKLPELTRRSILMLKQAHPDFGCQRISDLLLRGPGLPAGPGAVARVLQEAGYVSAEQPTKPHPDHVRSFERARPNQLWQTDLFTFMLKRQNRRVYLVAFMDDHSRFIVSYGLHASQSAALVLEVFRAGVTSCGTPEEVLTDNGTQYVTWRGKSAFARELEKRGIRHVVASPHRPQTLGKIERFWGSLWRECLEAAVFIDLPDAQQRIGHFIDHYNFRRPHQALEGLVPADRFFQAAPEVKKTLQARVAANPLDLARTGLPKAPFYLTGQVGGKSFSVHAEGERVIMTQEGQQRREIELSPPPQPTEAMPAPVTGQGIVPSVLPVPAAEMPPGTSPLDEGLRQIHASLAATVVPPPAGGQS